MNRIRTADDILAYLRPIYADWLDRHPAASESAKRAYLDGLRDGWNHMKTSLEAALREDMALEAQG